MIEADIQIVGGDWHSVIAGPEALVRRVVEAVGAHESASQSGTAGDLVSGEVSVALSDDAHVHDLNRRFRAKDTPTNVLAFPSPAGLLPEAGNCLGDVVLAFETVKQESRAQNKPFANHMSHLIVHGTLHLLGYDHENDRDAALMEAKERAILARLGIPDPYVTAMMTEAGTTPDG